MALEPDSLLSAGAATLAGATLLALAAAALRQGQTATVKARAPLDAVALLMLGLALWWPLHLSTGQMLLVRSGHLPAALAALAPLLMGGLAWAAHRAWLAGHKPGTAVAALCLLVVSWAVFESDPPTTPAVPAMAPALLAPLFVGALLASLAITGIDRWPQMARGLAIFCAAALLGYGCWRSSAGELGLQTTLGE